MGECFSTTPKGPELVRKEQKPNQCTLQAILLVPDELPMAKTAVQIHENPNTIIPPPLQNKKSESGKSLDLRLSGSQQVNASQNSSRQSDSCACSKEMGPTDSQIMLQLQEARRSSRLPPQINPTASYLVEGDRARASDDITLSLINGELCISNAQPILRQTHNSNILNGTRNESIEKSYNVGQIMEQSVAVVHSKWNERDEAAVVHPIIEQSVVMVQINAGGL